jgi:hypothetical protein
MLVKPILILAVSYTWDFEENSPTVPSAPPRPRRVLITTATGRTRKEDRHEQRYSAASLGSPTRHHVGLKLLTVANAALYIVAALLHLGLRIPLGFGTVSVPEPIPPATVVETLLGAGLAAAAVAQSVHAVANGD